MLLVIDAGNTNICLALFREQELLKVWRALPDLFKDVHKCSQWLQNELTGSSFCPNDVKNIIISCVVPDLLSDIKAFCLDLFSQEVLVIGESSAPFPHSSLIDRPGEEGADLMANAFAAHTLYGGGPLLVIDFGTATTLSLVDGSGNFCGTVIAPGVQLSLHALYQAAAKLPEVAIIKPRNVIGTNTVDSIQSGIFWGYVSMIEGLIQCIKDENFRGLLSKEFKVVATGGLSSLIAPSCSRITHIDFDLTLKGIALIYETLPERK